jgi:hypothetical protein
LPQHGEDPAQEEDVEAKSKGSRLYRQGLSYRTMIIKRFRKYAYEQIGLIWLS